MSALVCSILEISLQRHPESILVLHFNLVLILFIFKVALCWIANIKPLFPQSFGMDFQPPKTSKRLERIDKFRQVLNSCRNKLISLRSYMKNLNRDQLTLKSADLSEILTNLHEEPKRKYTIVKISLSQWDLDKLTWKIKTEINSCKNELISARSWQIYMKDQNRNKLI